VSFDDRSKWCASQWQGHICRFKTFEEREKAVEKEVPEHMKARVINHLKTVKALKDRAAEKSINKAKRR